MNDFELFNARYVKVIDKGEQDRNAFFSLKQPKADPLVRTTDIHEWPVPMRSDDAMLVEEENFALNASLGTHGVFVSGATGSGKSSGPMRQMALNLLRNGCSGLVLCAKAEEADIWRTYAEEAGRTNDLAFMSKERFDFVSYEDNRPVEEGGGLTENIVNAIMEMSVLARGGMDAKGEAFWEDAAKELLRNTIDFLKFSEKPVNLIAIRDVIAAAPKTPKDLAENAKIAQGTIDFIDQLQELENFDGEDAGRKRDVNLVSNYFLLDFPRMGDKMRSGIQATVSSLIDGLSRGELGNCFAMGDCTISPEEVSAHGLILICDFDVKQYELVGRQANAIVKYFFQKAMERRKDKSKFVFLYADEAQFFATQYDQKFQTTARSSKCITIYATQNLSNYYAEIGRDRTLALLGNLQTKICCQNSDPDTNEWASKLVGKALLKRRSHGSSIVTDASGKLSESKSDSLNEQLDYALPDTAFISLRMGGVPEFCRVEAILINPHVHKFLKQHSKDGRLPQYLLLRFDQACQENCQHKADHGGAPESCGRTCIESQTADLLSANVEKTLEKRLVVHCVMLRGMNNCPIPNFFISKDAASLVDQHEDSAEFRVQGSIAQLGAVFAVISKRDASVIDGVYGNDADARTAAKNDSIVQRYELKDLVLG